MLNRKQILDIKNVLENSLRHKFANHNPEPASMPFHTRLLGKDRLALYQFIQSLNTNFGTTIFEPVAIVLAKDRFKRAEKQTISGNKISEASLFEIQNIMDELTTSIEKPNKQKEIARIRKVCTKGKIRGVKPTKVDIYLESNSGELFLIDLKTAKPNMGEFKGFKRTLLEWIGVTLYENPDAKINTIIAIPYNPYEPKQYRRWTMAGMIDFDYELKVAKEFWDFIGGEGAYEDLLDCFEKVGIEMRDEIDNYFTRFK
ncbi:MAG: TdeIII family type II restriction endonuclease [Ignavibacteriaceae bacterium]